MYNILKYCSIYKGNRPEHVVPKILDIFTSDCAERAQSAGVRTEQHVLGVRTEEHALRKHNVAHNMYVCGHDW